MTVEVTQEDLDLIDAILDCRGDCDAMTQVLANFRIEATRAAADRIAELEGALGRAKDLLDCIVQTPGNTWYVSADDPETAVGDAYSAIDSALQRKEPGA